MPTCWDQISWRTAALTGSWVTVDVTPGGRSSCFLLANEDPLDETPDGEGRDVVDASMLEGSDSLAGLLGGIAVGISSVAILFGMELFAVCLGVELFSGCFGMELLAACFGSELVEGSSSLPMCELPSGSSISRP